MRTTIIQSVFVLILAFSAIVVFYLANQPASPAYASVSEAMEYQATTTGATTLNTRTLKDRYGSLAQVTVLGANTGTMTFYDATTSNATLRAGATSTLPIIAEFPANIAAGTYTFDARFINGLLLVVQGTPATSSVMFR